MLWRSTVRLSISGPRCLNTWRLAVNRPHCWNAWFPASKRPCPVWSLYARECGTVSTGQELQAEFLEILKNPVDEDIQKRFEKSMTGLQRVITNLRYKERLDFLKTLSGFRKPYDVTKYFYGFLELYVDNLQVLPEGETVNDRAAEIREVLRCFYRAGVTTERLRLLYLHIERDFESFEQTGGPLETTAAVDLCHTMLSTGLSSARAVTVLLKAILREPLMNFADDSVVLRKLKMIELLLRLDFLHTLSSLPKEVLEYLSIVRNLRYYDRAVRRDTELSYQLDYFLRKHSFPSKRQMVGPYGLKICDRKERIAFEPLENTDRNDQERHANQESPSARKKRHLEALGWRVFEVSDTLWKELRHREAKANHVRELLRSNQMLDT